MSNTTHIVLQCRNYVPLLFFSTCITKSITKNYAFLTQSSFEVSLNTRVSVDFNLSKHTLESNPRINKQALA